MENVFIRNKEAFQKKLDILKRGGSQSLHIITDFDRTLTLSQTKGQKISLSYHPLYECFKTEEYKTKIKKLFDHYHPLETSSSLTTSEKCEKMAEWWEKYFELIQEYKIKEEDLLREAKKTGFHFREGMIRFFKKINKEKIPVLVFSAGVTNIIEYYFRQTKVLEESTHIIANKLLFEDGRMIGYSKPLIYSFNKDERHVKHESYRKQIEKRRNVLLLGDQTSDLTMSDGTEHDCILKIGFLNSNIEENLQEFSEKFDALILNDGNFEFVNKIMDEIIR
jgi:5'-nucleotidase